jgi:ParB family transcriptional regulator, chromosome partitioning protein
LRQKLSVRALERLISKTEQEEEIEIEEIDSDHNRELAVLGNELQSLLGTKVAIARSGRGGKISVLFYSTEELNQIMDRIRKIRK